jgi:hypothetical protein
MQITRRNMTQHSKVSILILGMIVLSVFSGALSCKGSEETTTETFPESCAEVQEQAVEETGERPANGTYTLFIDGDESKPWDAYCHNMSRAEPSTYLTVSEDDNYSQIRNESDVAETTYRRLRIDPLTLEINPLDDTFASNNFPDEFTPVFPVDSMESIPLGWAEFQTSSYNESAAGEANVSLEGTPFVFDEAILDNELTTFFCQVDDNTMEYDQYDTTGTTEVSVAAGLSSFTLTAANTNSYYVEGVSTRVVADCEYMGADATEFEEAFFPLTYVGIE